VRSHVIRSLGHWVMKYRDLPRSGRKFTPSVEGHARARAPEGRGSGVGNVRGGAPRPFGAQARQEALREKLANATEPAERQRIEDVEAKRAARAARAEERGDPRANPQPKPARRKFQGAGRSWVRGARRTGLRPEERREAARKSRAPREKARRGEAQPSRTGRVAPAFRRLPSRREAPARETHEDPVAAFTASPREALRQTAVTVLCQEPSQTYV